MARKTKKRLKLTLLVLAALAVLLAFAISQMVRANQRYMTAQAQERLDATIQIMVEHMDQSYQGLALVFYDLLHSYRIHHSNEHLAQFAEAAKPLLLNALATLPQFTEYVIINERGVVIASNVPKAVGVHSQDREFFIEARKGARIPYLGKPVISWADGKRIVPLSWPIRDAEGRFRGLIAINFSSEYFAHTAERLLHSYPGATVAILYQDDTVFARGGIARRLSVDPVSDNNEDMSRIVIRRPSSKLPLVLVASMPVADVLAPLTGSTVLVWATFFVLTVGTGSLLLVLGRALVLSRQARLLAEQAGQAKTRFIAMVSHEIRTPLTGLMGLADLLGREPLTETQQGYVRSIAEAGETIRLIVNDILDIERLRGGKLRLKPVATDLRALLDEIEALYHERITAKQLSLTIETPETLPPLLLDRLRLGQILRNLISNAVKFTDRGSIRVVVELAPRMISVPDDNMGAPVWLRIEVHDTGCGIPQDQHARVFEHFGQFGHGQDEQEGSGLGLAISRMLARLMGGAMGFSSHEGEGSCFWLRVPSHAGNWRVPELDPQSPAVQDDPATPVAPRHQDEPIPDSAGLSLLVVEDADLNQRVMQAYLSRHGHRVVLADGAARALELMGQFRFDAALLDINLTDMDGWTLAESIRAMEGPAARTPLLLVSGMPADEAEPRALAAGFFAYVEKPVDWPRLLGLLATLPAATVDTQVDHSTAPAADEDDMPATAGAQQSQSGAEAWTAADALPVFDQAVLDELLDGLGRDTVSKLTGHFLDALDKFEAVAGSQQALDDAPAWRQACHDMKGMAGSLGIMRLGRLAELICRQGWPDGKGPQDYQAELIDLVVATRRALLATLDAAPTA